MEIIYKPVSDLIPYENNPRKNDDAVDYVANSIKEFGFKVPIIVGSDNVIVTGHTRLKAAIKLGLTEVPVIVADDLTEEQINAFRLADNKVAEVAEWDDARLLLELDGLDFDMSAFGFDLGDVEMPDEEYVPRADNGFNYVEQYGVIAICKDEAEQEQVYNRLVGEGFNCRVVTT